MPAMTVADNGGAYICSTDSCTVSNDYSLVFGIDREDISGPVSILFNTVSLAFVSFDVTIGFASQSPAASSPSTVARWL